jgi:pimeloyl-ACP methyl ester carboxylesterase
MRRRELRVRDTPVDFLADGEGAPLLFLHGAGGAGRWLPFQEELARSFAVHFPSHPGHGGSPAAEWIEHISDLAFHYLDLLDALALPRVHLVGASFGGWIAAEIAVMAPHRLSSLVLIDPVGITVEGWISTS